MRYPLLNLLACPMCKNFPLRLYVIEKKVSERDYAVTKPFCDYYCGRYEKSVSSLDVNKLECELCVKEDVLSGVLLCERCGRWYPIINGIPFMYPDSRRLHPKVKSREEEFLKKYRDLLPSDVREKIK